MADKNDNSEMTVADKMFDQYVRATATGDSMELVKHMEDSGLKCMIQLHSNRCVGCGIAIQVVDSVCGEHKPTPGDVLICNKCGNCMFFNEDMSLSYAPPSYREKIEDGVIEVFQRIKGIEVVFRGIEN